jgi:hypothetical protein
MRKKIFQEVFDASTDAKIAGKIKVGPARIRKEIRKARNFHAKGIIKEISEDFRSFTLECSRDQIKGIQTPPRLEKMKIPVNLTFEDSILLKHWFKIGDLIKLDLVYYIIYADDSGDKTVSKIYYRNILE